MGFFGMDDKPETSARVKGGRDGIHTGHGPQFR
jgi:hypothetical protein